MRSKKAVKREQREIQLNLFQMAALAYAFNKEHITIERWAKKGHYALTTPAAQEVIKQFEKIPDIQLITE